MNFFGFKGKKTKFTPEDEKIFEALREADEEIEKSSRSASHIKIECEISRYVARRAKNGEKPQKNKKPAAEKK